MKYNIFFNIRKYLQISSFWECICLKMTRLTWFRNAKNVFQNLKIEFFPNYKKSILVFRFVKIATTDINKPFLLLVHTYCFLVTFIKLHSWKWGYMSDQIFFIFCELWQSFWEKLDPIQYGPLWGCSWMGGGSKKASPA